MAKAKIRHSYVIGDIQGCYDELRKLLDRVRFDPNKDRLWLTGDLVNRGPKSLKVLRYVKSLGDAAITVLGNHDLHLLAASAGVKPQRLDPTLTQVINAKDSEELLHWLRHRPLLHREKPPAWPHEWVMVHAGLPPQWSISQAQRLAREVEDVLRGEHYQEFFAAMYGDSPDLWSEDLKGWARLRFITNCLTRMRYCTKKGRLMLEEKSRPGKQSPKAMPWFMAPDRQHSEAGILFGHWSTLGQVVWSTARVYGLDGGCLWGGKLIALRLQDMSLTYLPSKGYKKPG